MSTNAQFSVGGCGEEVLLLRLQSQAERVACWVLCAGTALSLQNALPLMGQAKPLAGSGGHRVQAAYFEGRSINLTMTPPQPGQRPLKLGPWRFGAHTVRSTPSDHRPNLYLVAHRGQDAASDVKQGETGAVINTLPGDGAAVDWDVYWVLVLDPEAEQDFRSERELLLAAQNEFRPGETFSFDSIPSSAFLRRYLKVDSLGGLDKYRRRNGRLPQVLIAPAGFTVRAAAEEAYPPEPSR